VRRGATDLVKVVDFGISTFIDAMAEHERQVDLTPTGFTMATPFYASPEQIRGANGRDPRVDLYAVGVLLYEMLTAHRPFEGDNLPDLCMSILAGKITPLAAFRKDVPRALEKVVRRALATGVQERYQNAQELVLALVPFGAERPRFDEPEPTDTFTADLRTIDASVEDGAAAGFPVQAALVHGLLSHFDERFGVARCDEVLAGARGAVQEVRALVPCDSDLLARALTLLDQKLARGDRTEITAAGRHAARSFRNTDELPKSTTPELFFSLSARIWQRHFGAGQARVSSVGRGYGKLEVRGEERRSVALVLALLGLLEEGLRMAGGLTVSVRLISCSALGDAHDAFEASWT
jgi:serine/threonine-protein kinase